MPSWSSRLLLGGPAQTPPANTVVSRARLDDRGDTRHADGEGRRRNTVTRQHSRSFSHPFPLFGTGKKKNRNAAPDLSFDSTDDEWTPASPAEVYSNNWAVRPATGKKVEDKDFLTSNCMVCDSSVKYPRNVKVFRCAGCLTVNDLEPIQHAPPESHAERDGRPVSRSKTDTYPASVPNVKVYPLSVERTRAIIDRCLETYFQDRTARHIRDSEQSKARVSGDVATHSHAQRERKDWERLREPVTTPPVNTGVVSPNEKPSNTYFSSPTSYTDGGTHQLSTSLPSDDALHPGFGPVRSSSKRPAKPTRSPPPPPVQRPAQTGKLSVDIHGPDPASRPRSSSHHLPDDVDDRRRYEHAKAMFRPLESYIIDNFGNYECLNTSFQPRRPKHALRAKSESSVGLNAEPMEENLNTPSGFLPSELDPKTLLIGDFAENGSWWSGRADHKNPQHQDGPSRARSATRLSAQQLVNSRSPRINWAEVRRWYSTVLGAAQNWQASLGKWEESQSGTTHATFQKDDIQDMEHEIREARVHTQRTLLKVTENLLKRPGRLLREPDDIRFLLILLENPLLYPWNEGSHERDGGTPPVQFDMPNVKSSPALGKSPKSRTREPGAHSGIIKRILGLLSNLPHECHRYLVMWLSRFNEDQFRRLVDLVGGFVTHRLGRQQGRKRSRSQNPANDLIPDLSDRSSSSAQLHAALGLGSAVGSVSRTASDTHSPPSYADDWQVRAAAKAMALLFGANTVYRKPEVVHAAPSVAGASSAGLAARQRARSHGQLLPTSDFYNSLLDYADLVADFEAWVKRTGKFSFCQYPFFLSIGGKIRILEYDTRKAMELKARDAFFDSLLTNRKSEPYFHLKVRRDCLVDDSLRSVSEAVGAGQEDIKKSLRVQFVGEEGIDAGGLRKEWFLLLVREVFDPNHGMFIYDDDSHFCYFNPHSFETSDQYFLVGAVLGLAIYNSTILDVALPPFTFKKLLAAAPTSTLAGNASRPVMSYSLEDLAEYRPALARGLRQLLEFDGDVQETFCRDFVAEIDRYGSVQEVPLCPNGENRPVTSQNRQEFVDLYVRYLLDTAVSRQFEPFKRGFFTVCSGNALSLFRPEEIELLVRGSDEPLDVASVKAVAVYENWTDAASGRAMAQPAERVDVIRWFWEFFEAGDAHDQRRILSFITGSDRIPAVGATSLVIKIACLGDDCDRYPVARTCFNVLQLYRYRSRRRLVEKLWRAVIESEGFGLK